MNNLETVLVNLLRTMDLPLYRKNAKHANLLWLQKNLAVRNSTHRQFVNTMRIIDNLLKR
jgi:hypothetical protein